jgi:hypothetical protein
VTEVKPIKISAELSRFLVDHAYADTWGTAWPVAAGGGQAT